MKKAKIVLIILIIIIISTLVLSYFKFNQTKEADYSGISKEKKDTETYKASYKNFEFEIPNDIKFSKVDDYTFLLKTNDWLAYIEIYYDMEHLIIKNSEKYYKYLKESYSAYNLD